MSRLPGDDERIARVLDGEKPARDARAALMAALADRLRDAGRDAELDPDAGFRSALREKLMARASGALPRPRTPDGPDAPHSVLARTYRRTPPVPAARPKDAVRRSRTARTERRLRVRRRVLVSVALVGFALSGSTMVASTDSLPGQPLYKVKLTVENVEAALARDPAERGRVHLAQARSRAEEIGKVAGDTRGDPEELLGTLDTMDRLTRTGVKELATAALSTSDSHTLADLGTWITDQRRLVDGTLPVLPGSARLRVSRSLSLLHDASTRVDALVSEPECACPPPPQDELGPVPREAGPSAASIPEPAPPTPEPPIDVGVLLDVITRLLTPLSPGD